MQADQQAMNGTSLKTIAYQQIKERILSGQIAQGERIREDKLADEMTFSRTPVREAVNQLVKDGLIRNVPRKGLFCVTIDEKMIDEVCDIRKMVDAYAVRRCAGRCTKEQIQYLDHIVDQIIEKWNPSHESETDIYYPLEKNLLHNEFHHKIVEWAGNELLLRIEDVYRNYLTIFMSTLNIYGMHTMYLDISNNDHRLLVRYIDENKAEEAEALIRVHTENLRQNLHKAMELSKAFD